MLYGLIAVAIAAIGLVACGARAQLKQYREQAAEQSMKILTHMCDRGLDLSIKDVQNGLLLPYTVVSMGIKNLLGNDLIEIAPLPVERSASEQPYRVTAKGHMFEALYNSD